MKKVKKFFVVTFVLSITLVLTLAIYVLAMRLLDREINVPNYISIFFNKEIEIEIDNNLTSFKSIPVKGFLKESEYTGDIQYSKLIYGNTIVNVPLPEGLMKNNYKDTLYLEDGSLYVALSRNKSIYSGSEVSVEYNKLGYNSPVVIQVQIPNEDIIIYIQCYTPEVLSFYYNLDWNNLEYSKSSINLLRTSDAIAESTKIKENIIPESKDMFIDEVYISLVKSNRLEFEGYSDFIYFMDKTFTYHRSIGLLNNLMKVEYSRLTSIGYTPIEYGNYNGVSYIKFKELTVLGSPITKNSALIYYITEE